MDVHSAKKSLLKIFLIILTGLVSLTSVLAHEAGESIVTSGKIPDTFSPFEPTTYIIVTCIWIFAVYVFIAVISKRYFNSHKKKIFLSIVIPIVLSSLYLAGHTIYENVTSETGGPVHWHIDYHVWACGQRLDLIDPSFPSNKIGTPLFHEHNDDRVHIEGTVSDLDDVTLGKYFETIGGELQDGHLRYLTTNGMVDYKNGDTCPDGTVGTLKVYINGKKIDDYYSYVPYPNSYIPPGDCAMIIFDSSNSDTTNLLCESWLVKGWNYDSYKRPQVSVGDRTWQ